MSLSGAFAAFTKDPQGYLTTLYQAGSIEVLKAYKQFEFGTNFRTILTSTSTELSFNVFASWVIVFLVLYVLFALMWKLLPGTGLQQGKLPFIAASRCIGTTHFFLVFPLACIALNERNSDWLNLEYLDVNSAREQRVIELSVGYFVADFVHFVLFEPDVLMFFHHVFSIGMMASSGWISRGGAAAAAALVQGEATNPFQSAWTVAKAAKAQGLLNWLSPLFTVVFVIVRVPLVPFWTGLINIDFWYSPNRSKMPPGLIECWTVLSVLMVLGGFLWSKSLIKGLMKFYSNKRKAKEAAKKEGKKSQ